ncbi:phospholipase-like protein [Tanacetum coccineum]|uniref:Phospholipase-like protein n=1 Tax=Tanacetum coccineum TaxID=301880 RepID=A0ABQ4WGF6_9ASTR
MVARGCPEYSITLIYVHTVARDNKFIVGFDESKCFLMSRDLMHVKIIGIGKQVNGLYYFNSMEGNLFKNSVVSSNNTKLNWHKRLGHPSDQVASSRFQGFCYEMRVAANSLSLRLDSTSAYLRVIILTLQPQNMELIDVFHVKLEKSFTCVDKEMNYWRTKDAKIGNWSCYLDKYVTKFGREEFCLITGLRFGPENYDHHVEGINPFKRLLFGSDIDGGHITGQMLLDKINGEKFSELQDEDVVVVCQLAVLHLVLLGRQPAYNIPEWWFRLRVDKNKWETYHWRSYFWAKKNVPRELRYANRSRWDRFYACQALPNRPPAKYTLSGFT